MTPSSSQLRTFPFGEGTAVCDTTDGTVVHIAHPRHPGMNFLLDDTQGRHYPAFHWGKGFIITDKGGGRWDHPQSLDMSADGVDVTYRPVAGVQLQVGRRFGAQWTEQYRVTNQMTAPVTLCSLAVSVPFRDHTPSAKECLVNACSAHIWTGGAFSYVWAIPMNGTGPGLGLSLDAGELWSYSVESRTQHTSSNFRGHLYLHLTDAARSPHTLGGQPEFVLNPGESYDLAWSLGWHEDFSAFERDALRTSVVIPALTAASNDQLMVECKPGIKLSAIEDVEVAQLQAGRFALTAPTPGVKHVDILDGGRRSRVAVLFHRPVRDIVEKRIDHILQHQRATDRDASHKGAFLPYDTESGLTVNGGGWRDWSDGRERLAIPILLLQARMRGWGDASAIDAALADFNAFCRAHLVDKEGNVLEDSLHPHPDRLYNFPWVAEFFLRQYQLRKNKADLLLSAQIFRQYYARGGTHFLAFVCDPLPDTIVDLYTLGEKAQAEELRELLLGHADYFMGLGHDLPKHEVNYEQTVVAPLVLLLEAAYRTRPNAATADALHERMRWLLAFAGHQPHVRLRHIPIRHWDGYWFGRNRQYGDTFPHYWSVMSAMAMLNYPAELGGFVDLRGMAREILEANLVHFRDDGAATCAFVYPSCVNGAPAHHEDPLANDQDWALVYYLKCEKMLEP